MDVAFLERHKSTKTKVMFRTDQNINEKIAKVLLNWALTDAIVGILRQKCNPVVI
jgi:hypothetical protein